MLFILILHFTYSSRARWCGLGENSNNERIRAEKQVVTLGNVGLQKFLVSILIRRKIINIMKSHSALIRQMKSDNTILFSMF